MKKNGMTLPEIMITVVIIGIISALLIPMANKAKPSETKIAFLKNYDELTRAVKELASNSKVFPVCQEGFCFEGFPFLNTESPDNTRFNAGNQKFCELLAFQYDVDKNCSPNAPGGNGTARGASGSFAESFTAKTGEDYRILTSRTLRAEGGSFISEILIDVNGDGNGSDCMYDAASCENPDTFRFWVTADGSIYPGDAASEFYLSTRNNAKEKTIIPTGNSFACPVSTVSKDNITTGNTSNTNNTDNTDNNTNTNNNTNNNNTNNNNNNNNYQPSNGKQTNNSNDLLMQDGDGRLHTHYSDIN